VNRPQGGATENAGQENDGQENDGQKCNTQNALLIIDAKIPQVSLVSQFVTVTE